MPDTRTTHRAFIATERGARMLSFFWVGIALLALIIWLSVIIAVAKNAAPTFMHGSYIVDDGMPVSFTLPLSLPSTGQNITIDFDLLRPWKYPSTLWIAADDCILSMQIDGIGVYPPDIVFPFCRSELTKFRLHDFLKKPMSHFMVTLQDHGGLAILKVQPATTNFLDTLLWIFGISGVLAWIGVCARILRWHATDAATAVIVACGVLLRLLYVAVTSYDMRAHEWDKHVEYVRYIAQHFSLPPAAGGWEFHQPPLYYFLTGIWMYIATLLHRTTGMIHHDLQIISLSLSIATLLIGVAIAYRLFHGAAHRHQRLLFSALIAVFPVLVMFSSRITNDVLFQCLSFLFVLFLIRFWHYHRIQDFWGQTFVIIIAFLTKLSGLIFLPVSILSILCMRGMTQYRKIKLISLMIIFFLGMTAWLPILRYAIEQDRTRSVYFYSDGINPSINLMNMPHNYLIFNPLQILRHPFNNPNSDLERRQFFPEYFYKSAFFGEFSFPASFSTLAFLILSLGFMSLLMVLIGIVQAFRAKTHEFFPLLLILMVNLVSAIFFRFLAPFAAAQDFRHVTVLAIPWFFFALVGASALPASLRRFCFSILWAWVAVCALLFLKIFFNPPL